MLVQDELPRGATLVPVLLGIDQTHLNIIGRAHAYPLYISIGNIHKRMRCKYSRNAYVLLALFPVLEGIGAELQKTTFTQAKRVLYHKCMETVLHKLKEPG